MKIQIGDIVRYNKKTFGYMYNGLPPTSFMIVIKIHKTNNLFTGFMFPSNEEMLCREDEVVKVKSRKTK